MALAREGEGPDVRASSERSEADSALAAASSARSESVAAESLEAAAEPVAEAESAEGEGDPLPPPLPPPHPSNDSAFLAPAASERGKAAAPLCAVALVAASASLPGGVVGGIGVAGVGAAASLFPAPSMDCIPSRDFAFRVWHVWLLWGGSERGCMQQSVPHSR